MVPPPYRLDPYHLPQSTWWQNQEETRPEVSTAFLVRGWGGVGSGCEWKANHRGLGTADNPPSAAGLLGDCRATAGRGESRHREGLRSCCLGGGGGWRFGNGRQKSNGQKGLGLNEEAINSIVDRTTARTVALRVLKHQKGAKPKPFKCHLSKGTRPP